MASARNVEAVDRLGKGCFKLLSRLPLLSPDEFGFDGFEEGLDSCVVPRVKPEDRLHNYLYRSWMG